MSNKKELKDEELEKTSGGMKIIIPNVIEKYKELIMKIYEKNKNRKRN